MYQCLSAASSVMVHSTQRIPFLMTDPLLFVKSSLRQFALCAPLASRLWLCWSLPVLFFQISTPCWPIRVVLLYPIGLLHNHPAPGSLLWCQFVTGQSGT